MAVSTTQPLVGSDGDFGLRVSSLNNCPCCQVFACEGVAGVEG